MERKELRKCKKTLNILRIAATDKENLTSKINKKKPNSSSNNKVSRDLNGKKKKSNETNKMVHIDGSNNKTVANNLSQSTSIFESDLIIDNPSENYWQNLAENRRKTLDCALKENIDLHNKVNELEYENRRLKAMLEEAKSLVEVLTEMIEESNDNSSANPVDSNTLNNIIIKNSDSDVEDMSFQASS